MEVYTGQPQDAPFDNIYQTKNYILFDLELSSRASLVVQSVKSLPAMEKTWVWSLGQEDSLEKEMASHPSILAWRTHGERSLAGYSPWGRKESDTTEWLSLHFTSLLRMYAKDTHLGKRYLKKKKNQCSKAYWSKTWGKLKCLLRLNNE